MSKRPTIRDLAQRAKVSAATVDRVLNGRLPVREATAQRVYEAALALDYHAASLVRQRVFQKLPECRVGVLFRPPDPLFCQMMKQHLQQAAKGHSGARVQVQFEHAPSASATMLIEKMHMLAESNHAIAVVAPDYPQVANVVEELKSRKIAVFALLSDIANGIRAGYVGLNNRKFGRTAAWFIARTARTGYGKIACFVGSHRYHGHELREIGLRSYFRECAPQFEVIETVANLENDDVTFEATLHLMQQHPDLAGMFVAGGGAEGAIAALRETCGTPPFPVVISELTPPRRMALVDGVVSLVLATPLPTLSGALLNAMVDSILTPDKQSPGDIFVPFEMHCPESV